MTQKSFDKLFESLSALVDDEASELELHRILKASSTEKEVRERWARYNLIGAAMRREPMPALSVDISKAVSQAIHSEPEVTADQSGAASDTATSEAPSSTKSGQPALRWQAWLGKSAVAASVAVAFVFGFAQLQQSGSQAGAQAPVLAETTPVIDSSSLSAPLGFELPAVESRTVSAGQGSPSARSVVINPQPVVVGEDYTDVQSQELLNQLHILHAQRASANGLGLLPFARVSRMDEVSGQ